MVNRLGKIILIGIIVPFAIFFWPSSLGGDTEFLIVQGDSMLPTILPGSFVIAKQMSNYEIDDIVAFVLPVRSGETNVVHRIIDVQPEGFVIKGDNNARADKGFHTNEDILGKVIFATPFFGDVLFLLRNPAFLIMAGVILAIIQIQQKKSREKKEKIQRILYGVPKEVNTLNKSNKKSKKHPYAIFWIAILVNVITYVLLQLSIVNQIELQGDQITGSLFVTLDPSSASAISFGIYTMFLFFLLYLAKNHAKKKKFSYKSKTKPKSSSTQGSKQQLLVKKHIFPIRVVCQFLCGMFIIMSIFHIITFVPDLIQVFIPLS